jgi:oligosaccharide repeat unit polymerase
MFPLWIFLLFVVFVTLFALCFYLGEGHPFYPSFIVTGMFSLVSFVSFVYSWANGLDISFPSFAVLSLLVLAFVVGDCLFRSFYNTYLAKPALPFEKPLRLSVRWYWCLLAALLIAGVVAWQAKNLYDDVFSYFGPGTQPTNFSEFVKAARLLATNNLYSEPYLLSQLLALEKCLCYVFLFLFLRNLIFWGYKGRDLWLLAPWPFYLVSMFLTTGRTEFIMALVFFVLVLALGLQKKYAYTKKGNLRLGLYSLPLIALFLVAFFSNWVGRVAHPLDYLLFNYMGSSINAFDAVITSSQEPVTRFGEDTLYSLYSLLNTLTKGGIPALPNAKMDGVEVGEVWTNIYTGYYRWIIDYGYLGALSFSFFWGSAYSWLFSKIANKAHFNFWFLIAAWLVYPLVFLAIEDGFIAIYSFSLLYSVVYLLFFYWLFIAHPEKKLRSVSSTK